MHWLYASGTQARFAEVHRGMASPASVAHGGAARYMPKQRVAWCGIM